MTSTPAEAAADRARFEGLYREWYRPIVQVCRRHLGSEHDAEALAQEAFIRAWAAWHQYAQDRPFGPWVYSIARRLCSTEIAMGKRRRSLAARDVVPTHSRADDAFLDAVRHHGIEEALRALSPRARRLVMLRDLEGWSYEQIADLDRTTVEAVRGALKRARVAFRAAYQNVVGAPAAIGVAHAPTMRERWLRLVHHLQGMTQHLEPVVAGVALLLFPAAAGVAGTDPGAGPSAVGPSYAPAAAESTTARASSSGAAGPARTATMLKAPIPLAADALERVDPLDEGRFYSFTVSPSYEQDRAVFALGSRSGCNGPSCAVLLKSTDAGASWVRLPASGLGPGRLFLPPAYPGDERLFARSVNRVDGKDGLWTSGDGGMTFTSVALGFGAVSMSPRFSAGDPRIFLGAVDLVPVATEYRADEGKVEPLSLPLPHAVLPSDFAFGDAYTRDGTMLVSTVSRPLPALSGEVALKSAGVYRCRAHDCERVFEHPAVMPLAFSRVVGEGEAFLAWNRDMLYRSTDEGASFEALPMPGTELKALHAAGGRVLATTGAGLFTSADAGSSWTSVPVPPGWTLEDAALLPDGAIVVSPFPVNAPSFSCSVDGGATWAPSCRRPSSGALQS